MEKLYRDEVLLMFNVLTDKWELILISNNEIIDAEDRLIQLINKHDCLK